MVKTLVEVGGTLGILGGAWAAISKVVKKAYDDIIDVKKKPVPAPIKPGPIPVTSPPEYYNEGDYNEVYPVILHTTAPANPVTLKDDSIYTVILDPAVLERP